MKSYMNCIKYVEIAMIDKNIKRFCQVIEAITEANKSLDKERASFYDGGRSFEECNKSEIEQLVELQKELKVLLKEIQLNQTPLNSVDERKKLLVDFNQKMSEKYYWFMPADGKMIDEFLKNNI